MTDILLLGYYGFKNSGDDALLLSIIQQLKKTNNSLSLGVLSFNPRETKEQFGIDAVDRNNILSVIKAIKSAKMLVVGGGTLIQDSTSTKSLIYYLAVIKIAQAFKKKVMLYANGIGPIKEENRKITKRIINKVDVITLREQLSLEELKKIGVDKPKIIVTADSVFGIDYEKKPKNQEKQYQLVSVRSHKNLCENFCSDIARLCDKMYEEHNISTVFIPFQKKNDLEITEKIRNLMKSESEVFDTECNFSDLMSLMENARLCIGMRLHSLIYSVISKIPCVGLVYDQKVKAFMDYIGQKNYLDAHSLNYRDLMEKVDYALENDEEIKEELENKSLELRELSQKNVQIAIELLKG